MTRAPMSRTGIRLALVTLAATAVTAGCAGTDAADGPSTTSSPTSSATASSPSSAPGGASPTGSASSPASGGSCAEQLVAALTPQQRAGQLVMVGLDPSSPPSALDAVIDRAHVGGVIYLGGWDGAETVTATSRHLQAQAGPNATAGVKLLIAADQEGGQIRQLRGAGFSDFPSAQTQAGWSPERITAQATTVARELKDVGINVNLAPVTDTVPASLGAANKPIGKWGRQYGSTPAQVSRGANAFITGMKAGGVAATVKHFPGLGRIRENTDFSASGITDTQAGRSDPYLEPFVSGWKAGAQLVMVGSARYPKLDETQRAMFSSAIVTDLLRTQLGWQGVVITDDLNAAAVADLPAGKRATDVIAAGVDIALTGKASDGAVMTSAIATKAAAEPRFAAAVQAAALRVLRLKVDLGLASCPR